MSEKEYWDIKFLGKIKDSGNFLLNDNSTIRYSLKIISNPPENFPENALRYLTSFSDELEDLGFIDDINLSSDERYNELSEFLDAHYIMFKVKSKHNEDSRSFYNAYDIELKRKEAENDNIFFPIPFIRTNPENTAKTLNKLFDNDYLQESFAISKESDDYPSFLLIGEYEHNLSENLYSNEKIEKLYAFGPIEGINYSEELGFKFITENEKSFYREIDLNELGEYYLSKDRVMFITSEKDNEIRELLRSQGTRINTQKNKEDINEIEFLKVLQEVALSKRLSYKPVDLYNFHTAMKTQSFVILAGLSGTGKSSIVQCYYEALNKFANKGRSSTLKKSKLLFVPVRPFWQDDSDLLGYLDSSQGIYRPGESGLVDFIIEAKENPDECYIVCLDEMNLAKVEHYFSQFLSILEREVNDRHINLYNEKLNGRVYNQNDYPPKIILGENLFFVGTVNIDESTFQFSDKVLDRANIITLNISSFKDVRASIVDSFDPINKKKESFETEERIKEPLKTYTKLKSMIRNHNYDVLTEEEVSLLWEIHLQMQRANRQIGVGYRIIGQIEQYLVNLPNTEHLTRSDALDLQVTQRIFTKLRGSQGQLAELIGQTENGQYIEGELYKLLNTNSGLSDFDLAKLKLKSLAKELEEYGHTI
ncbi:hypothetical protein J22TS1_05170 [Siminovitchia terrae]|uniref:McrB family protein n=1 Tax=Siminovitchia terrae TaxID=1914933 RepID=UPI001B038F09|nr:AAA family ATPase [Siminovitchia terrae]GIN89466.1 hypothetical protein J22TS1_05170 [Siminovitchia terrae]